MLFALAALQFIGLVDFMIVMPLGPPLVALAAWSLPSLAAHVDASTRHPLVRLLETLTVPAHRRAFALIGLLLFAAFSVIPFISTAFVANVGVTEAQIPLVFIAGGLIIEGGAGEPLRHFGTVGIIAVVATIASPWLATRIRPVA